MVFGPGEQTNLPSIITKYDVRHNGLSFIMAILPGELMINTANMRSKTVIGMVTMMAIVGLTACGGDDGAGKGDQRRTPPGGGGAPAATEQGKSDADMVTAADIQLGDIDQGMVTKGKEIADMKCTACHSMGPNRVVGPGWKGITERRQPEWIMNMMLNIDVMLATDEEAQRQLEECLVRMPNQGLTFDEGRQVLEYMRTL
jgi:hypothetical protein